MYSIVSYCSESYLPRLKTTIQNWINQKTVKNIFVYTDSLADACFLNKQDPEGKLRFIELRSLENEEENFGSNCAKKCKSLNNILNSPLLKTENLLLLDVDCMFIKDIDDIFNKDSNVIVTVYPEVKERYRTNNISSGFVGVKKNQLGIEFATKWLEKQELSGHERPCRDQKSLSELVTENFKKLNDKYSIELLNGNAFNSHPYAGNKGHVVEWMNRLKLYKKEVHIVHFSSGTIEDQRVVDNALIMLYVQE